MNKTIDIIHEIAGKIVLHGHVKVIMAPGVFDALAPHLSEYLLEVDNDIPEIETEPGSFESSIFIIPIKLGLKKVHERDRRNRTNLQQRRDRKVVQRGG